MISKNENAYNGSAIFSKLIIVIILFIGSTTFSQNENPPEVKIAGTQLLSIHSDIAGQDYNLLINLPRNYGDQSKSFPVQYLIDAQWDFPLVQAIFGEQYYDGFVPEMIVVGITWGGKNPNYDSLRAADLTPTKTQSVPQSGNAPIFLKFIKTELIPFIDKKFRTVKNDRTLTGSSYGGLFTLYAMFTETSVFNKYVLTSPAIAFGNNTIDKMEQEYYDKNKNLPVKLFMGIGEYEDVKGFQKFTDKLNSRNYEGFKMETRVLEGFGHSGGKAEGYSRGLQFVFEKPNLKLGNEILDKYTGNYKLGPMANIKVSSKDGLLIVDAPGNQTISLLAESESDFYMKGAYVFVHFKKDAEGKVTGFELETFGGKMNLDKAD